MVAQRQKITENLKYSLYKAKQKAAKSRDRNQLQAQCSYWVWDYYLTLTGKTANFK